MLSFIRENNLWYVDIKWYLSKDNLQMVGGADKLLSYLSNGENKITLLVSTSYKENWNILVKESSTLLGGVTYYSQILNREIWLCPVTLFVLGKYPKKIYYKIVN